VLDRLGAALQDRLGCDRAADREARERCKEAQGAAARAAPPIPPFTRKKQQELAGAPPPPRGVRTVVGPLNLPGGGGALGLPDPIGVRIIIPFEPAKAIEPIPPSTLRGDDDALRPRPRPSPP